MLRRNARVHSSIATISALAAAFVTASASAQCPPHWEPIGIPDASGSVKSMVFHNDGAGPALFIAGTFGSVGGVPALSAARISNGTVQPLGDGLTGYYISLATFDDGTGAKLYAGGSFTQTGSTPVARLVRWDGASWTEVGGGVNGTVNSLVVHNDGSGNALFVGGDFTSVGGMAVSNIARWNGQTWNSLAGGVTSSANFDKVKALYSRTDLPSPVLYAAGRIVTAGGAPATPVVQWNGTSWSNVGNEATGNTTLTVNALAVYNIGLAPEIFRGTSTNLQRLTLNTTWISVGTIAPVNTLFVRHDGTPRGVLMIGTTQNTQPVHGALMQFDGTNVVDVGNVTGGCWSLNEEIGAQGSTLLVGGSFNSAGGVPARNFARLSPTQVWQAGEPVMHNGTFTGYLKSADGSATYVSSQNSGVSRLAGDSLTRLPTPSGTISGGVNQLEFVDINGAPTLVAAGFLTVGGSSRDLYAWRSDQPFTIPAVYNSAVSPNFSATGLCLSRSTSTPSLLMAGRFRVTSDAGFHSLLRYGSSGVSIVAAEPYANMWGGYMFSRITPSGEYIYITDEASSGSIPPVQILDPSGIWTAIPGTLTYQGGTSGYFEYCVAWFDDGDGGALYLGGQFDTIDGQPAHSIAKVVGNTLQPLPFGVGGTAPQIHDLAVFDDGTGPALYAAGRFESAGVGSANNIARFKNGQWSAVGGGVTKPTSVSAYSPAIYRLRVATDSTGDWLYAIGNFMVADGQYSPKVARYGHCRCPSDFNRDNAVDFFDYLDFVQAFAANDGAADFNHDSVIDFFDYLDFVAAFSTGC